MRCLSCNRRLSEYDATVKYASSGEFLDLCRNCRRDIPSNVLLIERADLASNESPHDDVDNGEAEES